MPIFIIVFIEVFISCSLITYTAYHLLKDLSKYIPIWYHKWVKGECRHFCMTCKNYPVCKIELGIDKDYTKGFNDGYICGSEDSQTEISKQAEFDAYNLGYADGIKHGYDKAYNEIISHYDKR